MATVLGENEGTLNKTRAATNYLLVKHGADCLLN